MKALVRPLALTLLAAFLPFAHQLPAATVDADSARITVSATGLRSAVPVFFSADAEQTVAIAPDSITGETTLRIRVVQGRPETLGLGLSGDGEIVSVSGPELRDWAVRRGAGEAASQRFLDLRLVAPPATAKKNADDDPRANTTLEFTVRTRIERPALPGRAALPLITASDAVGFSSRLLVRAAPTLDLRYAELAGLVAAAPEPAPGERRFTLAADASPRLVVSLARRGAASDEAEFASGRLSGAYTDDSSGVLFNLSAQAQVPREGARLRMLSGRAAPVDITSGDGWNIELINPNAPPEEAAYDLVFTRKGSVSVALRFVAAVRADGDWRRIDFTVPAGTAIPLVLSGLPAEIAFDKNAGVVPTFLGADKMTEWRGFLPADGRATLGWKQTREAAEAALFFTSTELSDVRVGSGLLRQSSAIGFRVLQGRMTGARLRIEGPGEIVGVEGANLLGWQVLAPAATEAAGSARVLELKLSRPLSAEASFTVRSQSPLGAFPVRAEPLRLVPEGGVRHSGFVRVANSGAVRLEVVDLAGLLQLAPAQFPGGAAEADARQVFVYRFPSAERAFRVVASQIMPEVSVSSVALYELGETNRILSAELELDVREAPLRDWTVLVPADHAVLAVEGAEVADYVAETAEILTGFLQQRRLKILFRNPISGRQLVRLRLEKNLPPTAGEWILPRLEFPDAKSVRGHVGAVAAAGFRLAPLATTGLAEVPLAYFPRQTRGLQQAFRLRSADWSARLSVEALGQSVQADVFHLYSLKEGVAYASVLLNYFVVGAPATEWRVALPPGAGNIDVIGQNVRRDWRREGDELIVALHQPVLGAATLLVTFEEPMGARGGSLRPGVVRPLNVQSERGYVQVVSPLQVKSTVRGAEGSLLKLEPAELPAEYRLLTTSPSLAVYQYTARPFALELGVEWYAPGDPIDQVVDVARFSSRVARDGEVVTEARFFIKTRGRKALRLTLPADVKLWDASAEGQPVNARRDGDATLVPLPPRLNPNEPVEVFLRLGQPAGASASRVRLVAPRVAAPLVVGEWTLAPDEGRRLLPRGGNAGLVAPVVTEDGFEWLASRAIVPALGLVGLLGLAALALRAPGIRWTPFVLLAALVVLVVSAEYAKNARHDRRETLAAPSYAATLPASDEALTVEVANVPAWRAAFSWPGAAALAGAFVVAGAGLVGRPQRLRAVWPALAAALLTLGILLQPGGAVYFFLTTALAALLLVPAVLLRLWRAWRSRRRPAAPPPPEAPTAPAALSLILIAGLLAASFGSPTPARAEQKTLPPPPFAPTSSATAAERLVQNWSLRDGRLLSVADIEVRGRPGESFLLLDSPAVLTSFEGNGLKVVKVAREGGVSYLVTPERAGALTARFTYELAVPEPAKGIAVPTGPAAVNRIDARFNEGGWDFGSPQAVQVVPASDIGPDQSGASLVLGPGGRPVVTLSARRRDPGAEPMRFFVETSSLFVPGPGVVNGYARLAVKPVQGRVAALEVEVPEGFTVGDVGRGPAGAWRFDPVSRVLRLSVEPAQSQPFSLVVETQRAAAALPYDLTVQPLRVRGAAGSVGLLALAFGDDAQPEALRAPGASAVNAQDFDAGLLPRGRDDKPLALLHQVYRHDAEGGALSLRVAAVAPEVRVLSRQLLSLGDDRLVLNADLSVTITRVGLFKLSFPLPAGLEVESLSGPALAQWTEAEDAGQRVITLHLNGRTLGEQSFSLALAGPAPAARADWQVPRLLLREATRQAGDLQIVPAKGLRLRSAARENVSQIDPREVGNNKEGALAFRLLQADWKLAVGIEALEPWVTVQSLQEITTREGQTLTRLALRYRVENAAVKALRLRLPGLTPEQARTVRASGPAVGDFVPAPDAPDWWELRLQRGIIGETQVSVEYQGPAARDQGREEVAPPVFANVRQASQFVAVRAAGRLELDSPELPRGWQRADWNSVPAALQDRADRSVPALCFRVAEPERPLSVVVRRHEIADALKLRVTGGRLITLFSDDGAAATAAELNFDVREKTTLRVRLPGAARLFASLVNGESVATVREGDDWLLHVSPRTADDRGAVVRLVYLTPAAKNGAIELHGPGLNTPLENISWRVVLPPGRELARYEGGLRLQESRWSDLAELSDYREMESAKRKTESQQAVQLIAEANTLLLNGQQQQAGEVLSRAANVSSLDEATNEDARVQLRALKTQQAVVGLNTRRQRLYLDNSFDAVANAQIEQAANLNPLLMQGSLQYDAKQVDQLLMGNTQEETTALRGIAARIVDQQLAADPAPAAIDVTLPERGQVLVFDRGLQVDGASPLQLHLELRPERASGLGLGLILVAAVGVLGWLLRPRARFQA